MKRSSPMRRRVRVGAASRRRVAGGGVLALGRPSSTLAEWKKTKQRLWDAALGRCEVCSRPGVDADHIVKRSQGGSDNLDNLVLLCRRCHQLKDVPVGFGKVSICKYGDWIEVWIDGGAGCLWRRWQREEVTSGRNE